MVVSNAWLWKVSPKMAVTQLHDLASVSITQSVNSDMRPKLTLISGPCYRSQTPGSTLHVTTSSQPALLDAVTRGGQPARVHRDHNSKDAMIENSYSNTYKSTIQMSTKIPYAESLEDYLHIHIYIYFWGYSCSPGALWKYSKCQS